MPYIIAQHSGNPRTSDFRDASKVLEWVSFREVDKDRVAHGTGGAYNSGWISGAKELK